MKSKILTIAAFCILGKCLVLAEGEPVPARSPVQFDLRKSGTAGRPNMELWSLAGKFNQAERLCELPMLIAQRLFPDKEVELVHAIAENHEIGIIVRVDSTGRFASDMGIASGSEFDYAYLLFTNDMKASIQGKGLVPMPRSTKKTDPYALLYQTPLVWIANSRGIRGSQQSWAVEMQSPRRFSCNAEIGGQKVSRKFEYDVISFRVDGELQRSQLYGQSDFARFYHPEDARRLVKETLLFDPERPETIPEFAGDALVRHFGGLDGLETFFRPHVENEEVLQKFLKKVSMFQQIEEKKRSEWEASAPERARIQAEKAKDEEEARRQKVKEMDAKADKLDLELYEQARRESEREQKQREEDMAE